MTMLQRAIAAFSYFGIGFALLVSKDVTGLLLVKAHVGVAYALAACFAFGSWNLLACAIEMES